MFLLRICIRTFAMHFVFNHDPYGLETNNSIEYQLANTSLGNSVHVCGFISM